MVWTEQHTPGEEQADKEEHVRQAIRAAQAVVLVVSSQTRSSHIVKEHPRLADLYQQRLILVWVGDDEHEQPQHYGLRETVWIDAHDTQYAAALETIEANLSQRRSISDLLGLSHENQSKSHAIRTRGCTPSQPAMREISLAVTAWSTNWSKI